MSTPVLVASFYSRIWNHGDLAASSELLNKDFCFRGSLGVETRGYDAFGEYVRSVRTALAGFRCEILDCVTEHNKAFAKMRFTGIHVGTFRGDLAGLDAMLEMNAAPTGPNNMQV